MMVGFCFMWYAGFMRASPFSLLHTLTHDYWSWSTNWFMVDNVGIYTTHILKSVTQTKMPVSNNNNNIKSVAYKKQIKVTVDGFYHGILNNHWKSISLKWPCTYHKSAFLIVLVQIKSVKKSTTLLSSNESDFLLLSFPSC